MRQALTDLYHTMGAKMSVPSRFRRAAENLNQLMADGAEAKRAWATSESSLAVPATVAQRFDNLTVGRFYTLLIVGMACRGLRLEAESAGDSQMQDALQTLETSFGSWAAELEDEIDYKVIPIKTLVEIQLGAALHYISTL
jgi:hypothetical protein